MQTLVPVPISIAFLASHFHLFALSNLTCKTPYLQDAWVFKTLTAFWHLDVAAWMDMIPTGMGGCSRVSGCWAEGQQPCILLAA